MAINLRSFFLGLLIFVSVAFNFKLSESPPVFLSNILILTVNAVFLFTSMRFCQKSVITALLRLITFWFIVTFFAFLSRNNPNVFSVFPKIVLILLTFVAFTEFFKLNLKHIRFVFISYCLGMGVSPIFQVEFSEQVSSRIKVDNLGNFNAYAFLIAVSLLIAIYLYANWSSKLLKITLIITQLPLVVVLLLTLSRGGLFALFFGLIIYFFSGSRRAKLYFIFVSVLVLLLAVFYLSKFDSYEIFINRFFNANDREDFDSGRSIIYLIVLGEIFSSPITFLFGNGIGGINIDVLAEANIISAHNTYLDVFHAFGLIGFVLFVIFLVKNFRRINKMVQPQEKALFLALFGQVTFCFLYDSYWGATQVGWVFPFIFALFSSYEIKGNLTQKKKLV